MTENVANLGKDITHAPPMQTNGEKTKNIDDLAKTYFNTALNLGKQGKYKKAVETYKKAAEYHKKTENITALAATYHNMALDLGKQGKYKKAVETYKKATEHHKKTGNTIGLASAYDHMGGMLRHLLSSKPAPAHNSPVGNDYLNELKDIHLQIANAYFQSAQYWLSSGNLSAAAKLASAVCKDYLCLDNHGSMTAEITAAKGLLKACTPAAMDTNSIANEGTDV